MLWCVPRFPKGDVLRKDCQPPLLVSLIPQVYMALRNLCFQTEHILRNTDHPAPNYHHHRIRVPTFCLLFLKSARTINIGFDILR